MEILRICQKEKLPIKHYAINHLILLKIHNVMDLIEVLLQWFAKMFDKTSAGANTPGGAIKIEIMPNQQLAE